MDCTLRLGKKTFDHTGEAINCALGHLNTRKCIGCKHFAFHECTGLSQQSQEINTIKNKVNALDFKNFTSHTKFV